MSYNMEESRNLAGRPNKEQEKPKPAIDREPLVSKQYAEKIFSEIAMLVRSMPRLDEKTALSILSSAERIKKESADPELAMDRLMLIINHIDCESRISDSKFCMDFLGTMLSNRSFGVSWLNARNMDSITKLAAIIDSNANGDPGYDTKDAMIELAANRNFHPSFIESSCIALYRTCGYGSCLAARLLSGMLSNPNFQQEWLSLESAMRIADFAESMNNRRLGNMKFDYFDGAVNQLANPLTRIDPEMGVLYTMLNSLPGAHERKRH